MNVKYSKFVIAENLGDVILLHPDLELPQWKKLKDAALQHELSHTDSSTTSVRDVVQDVYDPQVGKAWLDLLKFNFLHPLTWWGIIFPFLLYKDEGGELVFYMDWGHLVIELVVVVLCALLYGAVRLFVLGG